MTLEEAIAVLGQEKHRGYDEWRTYREDYDAPISVYGHRGIYPAAPVLTEFEAIGLRPE